MGISQKPRYNLSLILQETGLKADTLRAWERRYGIPSPIRSAGGQRLYSDYDLEQTKWLCARLEEGMRIGQAAALWQELAAAGNDPLISSDRDSLHQESSDDLKQLKKRWIGFCLQYDDFQAENILTRAFTFFPDEKVCTELLLPALREIGGLWFAGEASVNQEHFASEIASRKLQSLIAAAPSPSRSQRILLANPPGEMHTLSLEMLTLLLKNRGWMVTYLGANTPHPELLETIKDSGADLAVFSAARLDTAANLLKVLITLAENGIQSAYGGGIFKRSPQLTERLPGVYLGEDLGQAVDTIEKMLTSPQTSVANTPLENPYSDLFRAIESSSLQISNQVLERYRKIAPSPSAAQLTEAIEMYLGDLLAGLKLGDPGLIRPNLDWIADLLATRGLDPDQLGILLEQLASAINDTLGPQAAPISDLMASLIDSEGKQS